MKTGTASPTIALAPPTASIGGQYGRVDWGLFSGTAYRLGAVQAVVGTGQTPREGSVDSDSEVEGPHSAYSHRTWSHIILPLFSCTEGLMTAGI